MDRILRRVRSLLAMADPKSGATEAERATARSLAGSLMKQNSIKESDVSRRPIAPSPYVVVIVSGLGGFGSNPTASTGTWEYAQ